VEIQAGKLLTDALSDDPVLPVPFFSRRTCFAPISHLYWTHIKGNRPDRGAIKMP
jgi:hypothetical protein